MIPPTEHADQLHAAKYRGPNEDFRESCNRRAFALSDGPKHYHEFREVILDQRFCEGGRVQGAAGASRQTTYYNCFVDGAIEDSLVDGDGSIMQRVFETAATSKLGGGIGHDFSLLRPRGTRVKKIETSATGPVSFMNVFNTVGLTVASTDHRRGAQMAVLRIDHPDVEEFVRAKQVKGALEGFNISVAVDDSFMEALAADGLYHLRFGGETYRDVRARDLWEKVMRATWDWAEPGVIYVDTINRTNPLWYCEKIAATNPCGEQPLPPFGACLLGSFNLTRYLRKNVDDDWWFDYDQLVFDVPIVVRAMDNVVDKSRYPIPQQAAEARNKRRMGLGVMGLANAGEALGHPYGSPGFLDFESKVLATIKVECYRASANIAAEKGAFPLFDAEKYLEGPFISGLPDDVRDLIRRNGIRNSHLTSIAPTGTIAMCAGNVSSGVEPVIFHSARRTIRGAEGPKEVVVEDYGVAFLGVRGRTSAEVTMREHVDVLLAAQRHVDSAVSKTINLDGNVVDYRDFEKVYVDVWEGGGKGCTTYNSAGLRGALITDARLNSGGPTESEGASCEVDPETGRRSCE